MTIASDRWIVFGVEASSRGVRIVLLGGFEVRVDGVRVDAKKWRLRKAKALVAMLALAPGQRRHRDEVLDRLWPDLDEAAAARNLHQTLYVARRALAGVGSATDGLLVIRGERVALDDTGAVDVDVLEFERSAVTALESGDEAALRAAAEHYGGDLLPDLPDAAWLTARRAELRETYRTVMVGLAAALRRRAPEQSIVLTTRVLESDPVHEPAVRLLMMSLADVGRRSESLARYERLTGDLLEAFGTDPDEQTAALFRELLVDSAPDKPETGYLPTSLTSFVGRERELGDVERLLGRARLVTLTGPGGCGKTRLAVEAARRVRAAYADGVWFVDLAAVGESLLVPDAVSEALGIEPGGGNSRGQALVGQLRRRSLLVVLDNCEHLLAACSELAAALLIGCPQVRLLATGREPLRVPGEYTFRVPSLALPASVHSGRAGAAGEMGMDAVDPAEVDTARMDVGAVDLGAVSAIASVRLFVERAAQVKPGFVLDAGNVQGVVDLCRRLDGMPLALELAAARIAILEPSEIVMRLSDALSVLGGGAIGATRHQTLRATLKWSHDLLTEPERTLLRRLAVFSGSFTLAALESVCADPPLDRGDLLDLLARLVDKSLVMTELTPAGTRYKQLEIVRQFGWENLEKAAELQRTSANHCAYYLSYAVAHNPERSTGLVLEQPKLLDREHDNLRAALRWACSHDPESALRLAASLWRFWFLRGHSVEGARWVERALAVAHEPTRPRAAALIGLTGLDSRQGRGDRHRALGAEALAIVLRIGRPEEVVMARVVETALAWSTFDLDEAEQMADEVRQEAIGLGRPEGAAAASWLLGQCALSRENGERAAGHFDACLAELADCPDGLAPFLPVITPSVQLVPVHHRVLPCFEETLLLGRRVGVRQAVGYLWSARGYAARLAGDCASAVTVVTAAVEQFAGMGDDLGRAQMLHQLGCVQRDSGDHPAARRSLMLARELRVGLGDRRGELLTEINLALLDTLDGDVDRGRSAARRCLVDFRAAGDHVGIGAALTILAAISVNDGKLRPAQDLYARAAGELAPWRRHAGWQWLMVAELSAELGDPRRASEAAARAVSAFGGTECVVAGPRLAVLNSRPGDVEIALS